MNIIKRVGLACAVTASAAALGGCVDDYGYGYGGPAVGYGPGGYGEYGPGQGYDGYYDGYYGGDGGYAYPGYFGWYGGFYYPGNGSYVYDRYRRPFRWNGSQQRYWNGQRHSYGVNNGGRNFRGSANWGGFNRGGGANVARPSGQAFRGGTHTGNYGGRGGYGGGGRHR